MVEIQFKKNVRVICDLSVGDIVYTEGYSPSFDSKNYKIAEIKAAIGRCESGFLVRVEGKDASAERSGPLPLSHPYPWMDSSWFNKR